MTFLEGLHGAVALVLLCSLLFAEEAGVPLPFAPGEIVLVVAGLLIATGGLDGYVFVPLAILSCVGGSFTGYSWANFVGERGLTIAASRLHQEKRVERVTTRIRAAGPKQLGVTRLVPGLRIYTSLVAGAVGVARRTFLLGVVPATIIWVLFFTAIGAVFGIPAARFLNQIEEFAIQGALLIVIGIGTYIAVRRIPGNRLTALARVPRVARLCLAITVDLGVLATLVTGIETLVRRIVGAGVADSWVDAAILAAVIIVAYFLVTRFGLGATAGEALLGTSYRSGGDERRAAAITTPGLQAASRRFRSLSDPGLLEVLNLLLDRERTINDIVVALGVAREEAMGRLRSLTRLGLVTPEVDGDDEGTRYEIAGSEVKDAVSQLMALQAPAELAAHEPPPPPLGDRERVPVRERRPEGTGSPP